jgi:hypothetical protein
MQFFHVIILCFIFSLIPFPGVASKVYFWTDDQGVPHITDRPPESPGRVIHSEKYREPTPEEIQRYEELRKLKQSQIEKEARPESSEYNTYQVMK